MDKNSKPAFSTRILSNERVIPESLRNLTEEEKLSIRLHLLQTSYDHQLHYFGPKETSEE